MAKEFYRCITLVHHDGKPYAAGQRVSLETGAAEALLAAKAIEAIGKDTADPASADTSADTAAPRA